MSEHVVGERRDSGDVLTVGLGTAVAMWGLGYLGRLPGTLIPAWLLFILLVTCLIVGGVYLGRNSRRGIRGGLGAGFVTSIVNLLVLLSLTRRGDGQGYDPAALWWMPASVLLGMAIVAIGAFIGVRSRAAAPPVANWRPWLAGVAVAATLLLIAVGGVVTGYGAGLAVPDWPNTFGSNMFLYPLAHMTGGVYYEHAHRLIGSLVGLTTLALAIYLQRHEPRAWVRGIGWLVFATVVVQGVLGGLRVTGSFTLSPEQADKTPSITLAVLHGIGAQLILGALVTICVVLSSAWKRDTPPAPAPAAGTDRAIATTLTVLVVVQLLLGALLRHLGRMDEGYAARWLHPHITVAVLVVLVAVAAGVRAWGLYAHVRGFAAIGRILMLLVGVQIALGIAALIAVGGTGRQNPGPGSVLITTAHQTTGALLLACGVTLTLWTRRLLSSAEPPFNPIVSSTATRDARRDPRPAETR